MHCTAEAFESGVCAGSLVCVVCVSVWACTNARPAVGGAQARADGAGPRAGRGAR
jgi:hypothetical protein